MVLGLIPSDAGLLCVQAGVVAAPRASDLRLSRFLSRFQGRGWALVPVASIVGVIFAIQAVPDTANWLTWLALIAVPLLAIAALGWLMHGARWWLALLVPVLFALVWRTPHSLWGEGAGTLLAGLSCVSLGVLLGNVTPSVWLKLGVIAMAGADVWLISTQTLQQPNDVLSAATPGAGLPQLQSEQWGSVTLGYGDLFVAGLLGAVWSQRRGQLGAALLTLAIAALFDLIYRHDFVTIGLPATVPVALALIVMELAQGLWRVSGRRGRWRPAGGTPRPDW